MHPIPLDLYEEIESLDPKTKSIFLKLLDYLTKERVSKDDFQGITEKVDKLADIVAELAEAQRKTEQKVAELAEAQRKTEQKVAELAEAQRKTEQKVAELAEAQRKTEQKVAELAEAQKRTDEELKSLSKTVDELSKTVDELSKTVDELSKTVDELSKTVAELSKTVDELSKAVAELAEAQKRTEGEVRTLAQELKRTRQDLGGLSLSFSYALENEAYRMLPQVLKKYGLELEDKLIRREIAGEEINFFATAKKEGKTVYIVGETKLRLDDTKKRDDVFKQLEKKISAVKKTYGDVEVVPLIVTHFAKERMLKRAKEKGIIVVQSFEW